MGKDQNTILLHEILEARRKITVKLEVGGETKEIPIVYNPSKFTPQLEAKINADESENLGDAFLNLLEPLFVDWGIMLPAEKTLPEGKTLEDLEPDERKDYQERKFEPTAENLRQMPFQILSLFVKAIMEDIVPKNPSAAR
jgi:hypothetical protein